MEGIRRNLPYFILAIAAAMVIPGCVGIPAQLMYVIYGNKIDAEFAGLAGKKVAVVCVSEASAYGPNTLTSTVERKIVARLSQNISKIHIIPQSTVDNWKDQYGWDESDFAQIGRGVGADAVVAIEISSYSLLDGATMYKGQVAVTTTVFDIKNENVAFQKGPEDYQFPKSGRPAIQLNERDFESIYLEKLCEHLSRRFYDYEKADSIAEDAGM